MLYKVTMKYFDGSGHCYGIMEGKFPNFNLAWKMVNLVKTENDKTIKIYKMDLAFEDEHSEYYKRSNITYTTCDGARRALKRSDIVIDGNRRLALNVSWGGADDDNNAETHVLILIDAVEDEDF